MKNDEFNLLDIDEGKTYIIMKKEDFYIAMFYICMVIFGTCIILIKIVQWF